MGLFTSNKKDSFPWNKLTTIEELKQVIADSKTHPTLVFKHSTRCSISVMVLNRFEKEMDPEKVSCYYLDLLNHRDISNEIAQLSNVEHQSPQVVVWNNEHVVYDASHNAIEAAAILKTI